MSRVRALALLLALSLASCGEGGGDTNERPGVRGALGGDARVTTLARVRLPAKPDGEVAWVADELRLVPGRPHRHRHEPSFVYVLDGPARVARARGQRRLEERRADFVPGGAHTHAAAGEPAVIWEVRLASPRVRPAADARRVFVSDSLKGIPERPLASLLEVTVPARGGETTVHTHPGPEFIYLLAGRIEYQNALIGSKELGPGAAEAIPPDTAVQKRNPFAADARFLAWFLVDQDEAFAPRARF